MKEVGVGVASGTLVAALLGYAYHLKEQSDARRKYVVAWQEMIIEFRSVQPRAFGDWLPWISIGLVLVSPFLTKFDRVASSGIPTAIVFFATVLLAVILVARIAGFVRRQPVLRESEWALGTVWAASTILMSTYAGSTADFWIQQWTGLPPGDFGEGRSVVTFIVAAWLLSLLLSLVFLAAFCIVVVTVMYREFRPPDAVAERAKPLPFVKMLLLAWFLAFASLLIVELMGSVKMVSLIVDSSKSAFVSFAFFENPVVPGSCKADGLPLSRIVGDGDLVVSTDHRGSGFLVVSCDIQRMLPNNPTGALP